MLADKLAAAVARHRMFSKGDLIVVAVSGGPDSVALLHCLGALRSSLSIRLHVAHLDHRLRGPESASDAEWVAGLAESLGVPATIAAADVNSVKQREKMTLEQAARLVRYHFLAAVARETKAVGVAVGHTAGDQVETVIMHLLRGAGTGGLRGMRPVNLLRLPRLGGTELASVRLLRPMLEVSRAEVMDYLRDHDLQWRSDASNEDVSIRRNRVRLEFLPVARRFNPKLDEVVLRSARVISADDDYLSELTLRLMAKVARRDGGRIIYDRAQWNELPCALRYRLLREGARQLQGDLLDISATHLDDAVVAIDNKPAGTVTVWPRGLRIVQRYSDFQLRSGNQAEASWLSDVGVLLRAPGVTEIGQWKVAAELRDAPCQRAGNRLHADLAADLALARLQVRKRRPGDRFQPKGMRQEKKLQDFLVDRKVPRDERDAVPLVVAGDRIAWAVGCGVADWAEARDGAQGIMCLTFVPVETSGS